MRTIQFLNNLHHVLLCIPHQKYMGTDTVTFEGVLPEVTWPKWRKSCDRKWRQSHDQKWPCPEVCNAHVQSEVAQYRPSRVFWPEVTKSRDRKRPCPEVVLTGSRFCACPAFSPRFFLSSSIMGTGYDQRSLDPFRGSLGCTQPEVAQHP